MAIWGGRTMVAGAILTVLLATACSASPAAQDASETDGEAPAPSYSVYRQTSQAITVTIGSNDPAELEAIVRDLARKNASLDALRIDFMCENHRYIAHAEMALTKIGAEQTDTKVGEPVVRALLPEVCAPPVPSAPGTVTAEQIETAVLAAGLHLGHIEDVSGGCSPRGTVEGCSRRLENDVFIVREWPSATEAEAFVAHQQQIEEIIVVGPSTTVSFPHPSEGRPEAVAAYTAAMAPLGR